MCQSPKVHMQQDWPNYKGDSGGVTNPELKSFIWEVGTTYAKTNQKGELGLGKLMR